MHVDCSHLDRSTHYVLVRLIECDGGDVTLLLTRDRHLLDEMGVGVPGFSKDLAEKEIKLEMKALPSLATGKGISIGMSPAAVVRRLGRASERKLSGSRNQFLNLTYTWQDDPGSGRIYSENYVFKGGKLIEVLFDWSPNHEDDAVAAPKAKKGVANPNEIGEKK